MTYSSATKIGLLFFTAFLSSCSYITTSVPRDPALLLQAKKAHVVRHADSTRDIDKYLRQAMIDRGVQTTVGTLAEKPADAEIYAEYVDRWYWDFVMYLRQLDIYVRDAKTEATLARANFRHVPLFHSFPNAERKTEQMVNRIYKKAAATKK